MQLPSQSSGSARFRKISVRSWTMLVALLDTDRTRDAEAVLGRDGSTCALVNKDEVLGSLRPRGRHSRWTAVRVKQRNAAGVL